MATRARYRVIGDFWGACTVVNGGTTIDTIGVIPLGTEVEWDGPPGINLEPINALAETAKAAEVERRAKLAETTDRPQPKFDATTMQMIAAVAAEAAAAAVQAVLAENQPNAKAKTRKAG